MTHQSLSLCLAYSIASGCIRVVATMVLAYPEHLKQQQQQQQQKQQQRDDEAGEAWNHTDNKSTQTRPKDEPFLWGPASNDSSLQPLMKPVAVMDNNIDDTSNDELRESRGRHGYPHHPISNDDDKEVADEEEHDNNRYYCLYLAAHLILLLLGAITMVLGTLHGPVSVAVPVQTAASLLANVVFLCNVLHMRTFAKAQRVGIAIMVLAVLSLVDVGPRVQVNQNATHLLATVPALLCVLTVTAILGWTTMWTIQDLKWQYHGSQASNCSDENHATNTTVANNAVESIASALQQLQDPTTAEIINNEEESSTRSPSRDDHALLQFAILLVGMTASNVAMATTGKAFGTLRGAALVLALFYYVVVSALGVLFSVISSQQCDQGIFTPAASVSLILTNAVVGLVVWQDYKAMGGDDDDTWTAYLCTLGLLCCGVYLLTDDDMEKMSHTAAAAAGSPSSHRFWRDLARTAAASNNEMATAAAAQYHLLVDNKVTKTTRAWGENDSLGAKTVTEFGAV